ncbi:succinylglutamate desuccinylase [Marinobacter psychrophilus]|jgi:succinylglutamate desuccinylase|uniref:Succinylglutamate desuccinylase n=1 Tax=Marinobacter psychrophilus TaxID=330734 RepID=A0A0H4I7J3_9GAMM|nr:succinylglutamate desuccinylase [Marinobacter psychrophilus]AKO53665.1 succinylglutamate desuccinylase [Marinobacter psychrophilus]
MTASSAFFNSKQDWLSHTLENASKALPQCRHRLPGGGELVQLGTGILQVSPPVDCQNTHQDAMMISAGVHGNETAPIEVLNQLVNELRSGALQPACPALLILGNPQAMVTGQRFIDANLNRLFSGAHRRDEVRQTPEAERAQQLEQLCQTFAEQTQARSLALSHYDLHTAIRSSQREKFALYAFVAGRQVPAEQCAFLLEADVHTLLLQHKAGTTFASFSSSALKAQSFTVELGQVKPFGQNDLSRFQGIHNALKRRLAGLPAPASAATAGEPAEMAIFQVVHEILNSGEDFQFHVPDDVANFTQYAPGTVIWEDSHQRYCVGERPEAIVFPNRDVPIGQRVGLLVSRLAV